ncbi:spliceosome RNA helicase DDX39B-like [Bradysia coprophila]|uniref:spliceosome RNA helicase DDX39B-like n=1 Tax=Bradysia coprophila TaxID=38358 RepID=UPI00187DA59F|nr:spliceosome RNA helicase DDX39B-like [Bradysia coprophila]
MADNQDERKVEQVVDGTAASPEKVANSACVSIFNSDFCDFIRKPEILRAIDDCGFEYPFKLQYKFMPQAVVGMDILCQAQSEAGKTTGFVLATLQQVESTADHVCALVICNKRVRAFHISQKYELFGGYMPALNVAVFIGGLPVKRDEELLKTMTPHIVVGTPGRILALVRSKRLILKRLKHIIVDDCGTSLEQMDMRRNIVEIFRNTPSEKQVMMFSTSSLSEESRATCRKFMHSDAIEIQ